MLSIVMPAYNEAQIIEGSLREWHELVASKIPGCEIIVVDDASTDESPALLARISAQLPGLRVIRSASNQGHGPSVLMGLRAAQNDYIFQTDSDLQFPTMEFWSLWDARGENDFILGVRTVRIDGPFRRGVSMGVRLLGLLVWGRWVRDANCAFKLMRRAPLARILRGIPDDSLIPMILIAFSAYSKGLKIKEVPVTHVPRRGGTPSLTGLSKWPLLALRCAGEILGLRFTESAPPGA